MAPSSKFSLGATEAFLELEHVCQQMENVKQQPVDQQVSHQHILFPQGSDSVLHPQTTQDALETVQDKPSPALPGQLSSLRVMARSLPETVFR
jgi:hypothetical protein